MGRRKKPLLKEVEIIDIGAEGKSVAKVNDMVLFVPYGIPGDIMDVQVKKKRKKYMEGTPVNIHKYSYLRTEPFCEHFGLCGGCKWQHLPYKHQLHYKEKQVFDNLRYIGKVNDFEPLPIIPSPDIKYYRNKLEYTFSNNRWLTQEEIESGKSIDDRNALGFHISGMFDRVLDIRKCYLQKPPSDEIRSALKKYALDEDLDFFDLRKQEGFLRNLIIRTSSIGEIMVIVSFFKEDKHKREGLLEHLLNIFPQINSLQYVINNKANDTILDQQIKVFKGKDHIIESMEGLNFIIGPKSFYQTNSYQAHQLYKTIVDFLEPESDELIFDLYTGTGTIAIFVSRFTKKVIGIEAVPEAVKDADKNAEYNKIQNVQFYTGDVKNVLNNDFFYLNGFPDTLIMDPPRAGVHQKVLELIKETGIKKLIYVSCNPATQARDIYLLSEKYQLVKVQPVDMFPHTHHVENIALLKIKNTI